MIAMVCIDDHGGMMFNNRRQSRDQVLQKNMINLSQNKKLYLNHYSYELFEPFCPANTIIDDEFLLKAKGGDYCFVENRSLIPYEEKIEELIVYKWNRNYPADFFLDIPLKNRQLIKSVDFRGFSHEKITMEIYIK
ncbi:MAG: ribonuclease Z [Anaerovorax sp.]